MPRLNLLTEKNLDFRRVFFADQRENRGVDCLEHLCGKWADIVEVELQSVECGNTGGGELLSCEFGCESHLGGLVL
jgi:hypothetical protein